MNRMVVPAASGIVLAGGRSSRFGRDKLAARFRGKPLIDHAVLALSELTTEVLVLVPPVGDAPLSARIPPTLRIRLVRDPEPFGGPLVALLAGLERADESFAIVAGGDMPSLVPAVLGAMLRALDNSEHVLVALEYRGRIEPLPLALRVGATTPLVRRLLGTGERSLRSLLTSTGAARLPEIDWRPLDPTAETLTDIDTPGDLGSK
jgi:molybdopterin-guanine dinucleotide biosynthesis protein A